VMQIISSSHFVHFPAKTNFLKPDVVLNASGLPGIPKLISPFRLYDCILMLVGGFRQAEGCPSKEGLNRNRIPSFPQI
jgi:hypothetical protein